MKAIEYAQRYIDNPTDDELIAIVLDMFSEAQEIIKARKAQSFHAQVTAVDEQQEKYKAFCRRVEKLSGGTIVPEETLFQETIKRYAYKDLYVHMRCGKDELIALLFAAKREAQKDQ